MKKIQICPDVVINDVPIRGTAETTDIDFTMVKFLNTCINSCEKFGKGLEGVSQGLKIKNAFESGKESFILEDAEYHALKKAINDCTINPIIAMGCKIYYEAVENAAEYHPPTDSEPESDSEGAEE